MNPSAIRCCTAWKLPIGRPNCSRPVVYSAAIRKARSDTPSWIAHRPTSARVYSELTRSPGPSSRSAAETVAPSRNTSACGSRVVVATGRDADPAGVGRQQEQAPRPVIYGGGNQHGVGELGRRHQLFGAVQPPVRAVATSGGGGVRRVGAAGLL